MLTGEAFYFSADGNYGTGVELYAHNVSNHSTWLVADIFQDYSSSSRNSSLPGDNMAVLIGDTLYFDARDDTTGLSQLWAHDTSNRTTWKVHDASAQGGSMTAFGARLVMVLGDTLYFRANLDTAYGVEMWAHDTSNQSTWLVSDQHPVHSFPGYAGTQFYHDGTMYFSTLTSAGHKLWAHSPLSINHQTNTGGAVTSWAINGSLPSGVTFNTQTGVLSGTPTELWPQTTYTVWANNSGGSSVAYLNITVVDQLPTIAYSASNLLLTNNTPSTDLPLVPTLTGAGEITSWAINASLPAGLTFETSNGTIWGTPTELWNTTAYMVWANNTGGSSVAYLNITVIDQLPTSLTYTPENVTMVRGEVSTTFRWCPRSPVQAKSRPGPSTEAYRPVCPSARPTERFGCAAGQHDHDHLHRVGQQHGRKPQHHHQHHRARARRGARLQPREHDPHPWRANGHAVPVGLGRECLQLGHLTRPARRSQLQRRCHQRHANGQHDAQHVHRVGEHVGRCDQPYRQHHHPRAVGQPFVLA